MRRALLTLAVVLVGAICAPAAMARVLLVGSYHGIHGRFTSVQAAVDAARPGDWILVGPGDYKTSSSRHPAGASTVPAGVLITKAGLKLRGMDRNRVVIDGTKPRSSRCSTRARDQNFGPPGTSGNLGLNGIMVFKANRVWVQNLTVCNFLGGAGNTGNEVWWNGGDGSGQIGGYGFFGSFLSTTSTFYAGERSAAKYGIFSSNWSGGSWDQAYASNFNDGAFYIGACQQACNQTMDHAHAQFNALGYSGTNSGGQLVIRNSEFDHNEDGFDTNSQNADFPSPQDGACPGGAISPITHTHSCWVFMDNYVHDNNNANVPAAGSAAAGPVGTGMSLSGARNDTIMHNTFARNNAWGVIFVPYADSGHPCTGGTIGNPLAPCLFSEWGNALTHNTFIDNGAYGHPTNGDFAWVTLEQNHPTNCWGANIRLGGGPPQPASAAALQSQYPVCDGHTPATTSSDSRFLGEVLCDSQIQITPGTAFPCPTGQYPRRTQVIMHPLPRQRSLPNPCAGVPANPWCPRRRR